MEMFFCLRMSLNLNVSLKKEYIYMYSWCVYIHVSPLYWKGQLHIHKAWWWSLVDVMRLFAQFGFFIRSQVKEWQETQQSLSGRVRDSIFRSSGCTVALPNLQPQYTGNRPRVNPLSMQRYTASVSQKKGFSGWILFRQFGFCTRWRRQEKKGQSLIADHEKTEKFPK